MTLIKNFQEDLFETLAEITRPNIANWRYCIQCKRTSHFERISNKDYECAVCGLLTL